MLSYPPVIGFINLGCPKALVDSEHLMTLLQAKGYEVTEDCENVDCIIINTCGFIHEAINESLDMIETAYNLNHKIVITGCLGVNEFLLRKRFPQLLGITKPGEFEKTAQLVQQVVPLKSNSPCLNLVDPIGIKLTPNHFAYLKIAEGCDHKCTFCIIPQLRGPLSSRPPKDILQEAQNLVDAGVKELILIAQDLSTYGKDIPTEIASWNNIILEPKLLDLVKALSDFGIWIRLHYLYPTPDIDQLISLMADHKILPYLDVPLQHANRTILNRMKRPYHQTNILKRIQHWRDICPDIAIRSTFMVGFPGETDKQFYELLDFLELVQFDRVGCFKYSPVDGATAHHHNELVPEYIQEERYDTLMRIQTEISANKLQKRIGTTLCVLVDEIDHKTDEIIARSYMDSPEVDGQVIIQSTDRFAHPIQSGNFINVVIESATEYDLYARPLDIG